MKFVREASKPGEPRAFLVWHHEGEMFRTHNLTDKLFEDAMKGTVIYDLRSQEVFDYESGEWKEVPFVDEDRPDSADRSENGGHQEGNQKAEGKKKSKRKKTRKP